MKLIIAGGGTGGHVLAGVAVADEWKKRYPHSKILFVGSLQGLESRLVPKAGYPLLVLPVGALNKVSWITRIRTLILLPFCFVKSLWILILFRPNAVLGVGGYASGPVLMMAALLSPILKIKTAILEQNLVSGFTNRKLGRFVQLVFCAFAESAKNFTHAQTVDTGNPIRSSFKRLPPPTVRPFTLFIFGGSQGALGMNTMVIDALPFLKDAGIQYIHQTGVKDFERVQAAYAKNGIPARVETFIDNMGACYQEASLVICRAGASSMSELASVGRAAIFVPLPTAADNHQELNARVFEAAGAAKIAPQGNFTGEQFAKFILELRDHPETIQTMVDRVVQFHRPDAAKSIVDSLSK